MDITMSKQPPAKTPDSPEAPSCDSATGAPSRQAPVLALAQDPEMISDFILESGEHLQSIEANLLRLERDSSDKEAIHAAFRAFHTIKGLAGFLEFTAIREVAHEVETVLDQARNGELVISAAVIDVVFESADYVKRWLASLESSNGSGRVPDAQDNCALVQKIHAVYSGQPAAEVPAGSPGEDQTMLDLAALARTMLDDAPLMPVAPAAVPASSPVPPVAALAEPSAATAAPEAPRERSAAKESRSVKVDTGKLDHLVDMVGEMVIAQSMIQHDPELALLNKPRLIRNLSQLARITDEVQKTAMSMRMVPIGALFQRMARVVRDLARKTGKEAELELIGEDTELDRNLVEELADPLMHMLRNSVDHGVESPDQRIARGKPRVARLRLRAAHESGNIVIEVRDDGNGLDRSRILQKAVQNGLVARDAVLSDSEVFNLIFQPGFSTAEKVTDVSGRGVGMDVVRKQVQKLRGRVEIHSVAGESTTFFLKLPLTLAIVDGLIVGVGGERYIMPLFAVREMLRPAADAVFSVQDKGEMALVRGRLLPVVRLYQRFGVAPRSEVPAESLMIVAESSSQPFAILVDDLIGKQEVVIKSLGPMLQDVPGVAGGAILGDGRVGLILDLDRVFQPVPSGEACHAGI